MVLQRCLLFVVFFVGCFQELYSAPVYSIPLPGGYLDVTAYSGSGPNTAYFVFDFSSNGGGQVAFGYRFSAANLTGIDGMNAFATNGLLTANYSDYGSTMPNLFLNSLAVGSFSDNPGAGGGYWSLWNGTATAANISWSFANNGLSGVTAVYGPAPDFEVTETLDDFLTDGEIYGMRVNYSGMIQPISPLATIPEPSTMAILGCSVVFAVVRGRRGWVS
jgi:hypothetical protein